MVKSLKGFWNRRLVIGISEIEGAFNVCGDDNGGVSRGF